MENSRSTAPILKGQGLNRSTAPSSLSCVDFAVATVEVIPKQIQVHPAAKVHQQTIKEAKELWRYEGNPN